MNSRLCIPVIKRSEIRKHSGKAALTALNPEDCYEPNGRIIPGQSCSWLSYGPHVSIISNKTGWEEVSTVFRIPRCIERRVVTCVCVIPLSDEPRAAMVLAIGREDGTLDFYNSGSSTVIKTLQFNAVVKCVTVLDRSGEPLLPEELQLMDGVMAVGLSNGAIHLVDLCTDICQQTIERGIATGQDVFSELIEIDMSADCMVTIQKKKLYADRHGHTLSIFLNSSSFRHPEEFIIGGRNSSNSTVTFQKDDVSVTCVRYFKEIMGLVVGFNVGCFQMWHLPSYKPIFVSHSENKDMPIVDLCMQEASDDPVFSTYLWEVSHSNGMVTSLPTAKMYMVEFTSKVHVIGYGSVFQDFKRCGCVFSVELGKNISARDGRIISCHTFSKTLPVSPVWLNYDKKSVTVCLCAVAWEVGSPENDDVTTQLTIIDLNQWYKAHQPEVPEKDDLFNNRKSYMMTLLLGAEGRFSDGPVLDVAISLSSIDHFLSIHRTDEHYFPTALDFECTCLTETEVCTYKWEGVQKTQLLALQRAGPSVLLNPSRTYKNFLTVGLKPAFHDMYDLSTQNAMMQREMLLTVMLEDGQVSFIKDCVKLWADGSQSAADCSLPALLRWMWSLITTYKQVSDKSCITLFDYSKDIPDLKDFNNCVKLLNSLLDLYRYILKNYHNFIHEHDVESQSKSLELVYWYLDMVKWFFHKSLLPEIDSEVSEGTKVIAYNLPVLQTKITTRRAEISQLNKTLPTELATGGSGLFMIDLLLKGVDGKTSSILDQWKKEGEASGLYPPPTIQSVLRMFLINDVPLKVKRYITHYFLLDLISALPDNRRNSNDVKNLLHEKFAYAMTLAETNMVKGLWYMDNKMFVEAVECLSKTPIRQDVLTEEQHGAILRALYVQDRATLALEYIRLRKPSMMRPQDKKLRMSLLMDCGLLLDALHFQRNYPNLQAELLKIFFTGCILQKKVDFIFKIQLSKYEEEALTSFLENSQHRSSEDIRVMYLLSRNRYVEAIDVHEKMSAKRSQSSLASGLRVGTPRSQAVRAKQDAFFTLRDEIVAGFRRALPPVTREWAEFCSKHRSELTSIKPAKSPTPLSSVVHTGQEGRVSVFKGSKDHFMHSVLKKTRELWAPSQDTVAAQPPMSRFRSELQNIPFVRPINWSPTTPLTAQQYKDIAKVFGGGDRKRELEETDVTDADVLVTPKRQKREGDINTYRYGMDSLLSSATRLKTRTPRGHADRMCDVGPTSIAQQETEMLPTPYVKKKLPASETPTPQLGTPQSALKSPWRNRSTQGGSDWRPSPVSFAPDLELEVDIEAEMKKRLARQQQQNLPTWSSPLPSSRQIRFNLPRIEDDIDDDSFTDTKSPSDQEQCDVNSEIPMEQVHDDDDDDVVVLVDKSEEKEEEEAHLGDLKSPNSSSLSTVASIASESSMKQGTQEPSSAAVTTTTDEFVSISSGDNKVDRGNIELPESVDDSYDSAPRNTSSNDDSPSKGEQQEMKTYANLSNAHHFVSNDDERLNHVDYVGEQDYEEEQQQSGVNVMNISSEHEMKSDDEENIGRSADSDKENAELEDSEMDEDDDDVYAELDNLELEMRDDSEDKYAGRRRKSLQYEEEEEEEEKEDKNMSGSSDVICLDESSQESKGGKSSDVDPLGVEGECSYDEYAGQESREQRRVHVKASQNVLVEEHDNDNYDDDVEEEEGGEEEEDDEDDDDDDEEEDIDVDDDDDDDDDDEDSYADEDDDNDEYEKDDEEFANEYLRVEVIDSNEKVLASSDRDSEINSVHHHSDEDNDEYDDDKTDNSDLDNSSNKSSQASEDDVNSSCHVPQDDKEAVKDKTELDFEEDYSKSSHETDHMVSSENVIEECENELQPDLVGKETNYSINKSEDFDVINLQLSTSNICYESSGVTEEPLSVDRNNTITTSDNDNKSFVEQHGSIVKHVKTPRSVQLEDRRRNRRSRSADVESKASGSLDVQQRIFKSSSQDLLQCDVKNSDLFKILNKSRLESSLPIEPSVSHEVESGPQKESLDIAVENKTTTDVNETIDNRKEPEANTTILPAIEEEESVEGSVSTAKEQDDNVDRSKMSFCVDMAEASKPSDTSITLSTSYTKEHPTTSKESDETGAPVAVEDASISKVSLKSSTSSSNDEVKIRRSRRSSSMSKFSEFPISYSRRSTASSMRRSGSTSSIMSDLSRWHTQAYADESTYSNAPSKLDESIGTFIKKIKYQNSQNVKTCTQSKSYRSSLRKSTKAPEKAVTLDIVDSSDEEVVQTSDIENNKNIMPIDTETIVDSNDVNNKTEPEQKKDSPLIAHDISVCGQGDDLDNKNISSAENNADAVSSTNSKDWEMTIQIDNVATVEEMMDEDNTGLTDTTQDKETKHEEHESITITTEDCAENTINVTDKQEKAIAGSTVGDEKQVVVEHESSRITTEDCAENTINVTDKQEKAIADSTVGDEKQVVAEHESSRITLEDCDESIIKVTDEQENTIKDTTVKEDLLTNEPNIEIFRKRMRKTRASSVTSDITPLGAASTHSTNETLHDCKVKKSASLQNINKEIKHSTRLKKFSLSMQEPSLFTTFNKRTRRKSTQIEDPSKSLTCSTDNETMNATQESNTSRRSIRAARRSQTSYRTSIRRSNANTANALYSASLRIVSSDEDEEAHTETNFNVPLNILSQAILKKAVTTSVESNKTQENVTSEVCKPNDSKLDSEIEFDNELVFVDETELDKREEVAKSAAVNVEVEEKKGAVRKQRLRRSPRKPRTKASKNVSDTGSGSDSDNSVSHTGLVKQHTKTQEVESNTGSDTSNVIEEKPKRRRYSKKGSSLNENPFSSSSEAKADALIAEALLLEQSHASKDKSSTPPKPKGKRKRPEPRSSLALPVIGEESDTESDLLNTTDQASSSTPTRKSVGRRSRLSVASTLHSSKLKMPPCSLEIIPSEDEDETISPIKKRKPSSEKSTKSPKKRTGKTDVKSVTVGRKKRTARGTASDRGQSDTEDDSRSVFSEPALLISDHLPQMTPPKKTTARKRQTRKVAIKGDVTLTEEQRTPTRRSLRGAPSEAGSSESSHSVRTTTSDHITRRTSTPKKTPNQKASDVEEYTTQRRLTRYQRSLLERGLDVTLSPQQPHTKVKEDDGKS